MISRILIDYMSTNRRLVLPEFGAFIRKDADGVVIFVEYLNRDDNVLSGLVAGAAGISESRAKSMIRSYISDIRRKTEADRICLIEGLGRLYIDSDGLYQLDYDPSAMPDTAPAATAASLQQLQQPGRQIKENEPAVPKPQPLPTEQEATAPRQTPEHPSRHTEEPYGEERPRTNHGEQKKHSYQRPPHKTMNPNAQPGNKRRADRVMLIAIIAAAAAVSVMLYGLLSDSEQRVQVELEDIPAMVNDSLN